MKKVIAFLCALALLVGLIPSGTGTVASAETTTEGATYDVGYAIKNINPWVPSSFDVTTQVGSAEFIADPENTADKKIYPSLFSQTGNQIDWNSVITQLHDDNGDGSVDHGDGIFATCTAVTYGGKTVLFITTDTMKAWDKLVTAVRDEIVASDWGQELGIQANQIMVSSNHTHSGPPLDGSFNQYIDTSVFTTTDMQTALKTDRENYYNWVIDRIVAAAEESVTDQKPATMSRGAINATEATAAKGYNSNKGYHMNTIRHYERTLTASANGEIATVSSIYANTAVPGNEKILAALKENNFAGYETFKSDTSYTTEWATTDDADNMMYVLRFEFEDTTKEPVVFVNWRAHSTMNSGILNHSVLSGDYATGLRKTLADEGYRAAFFLGAAGNVVPHPSDNVYTVNSKLVKNKMDWLYEATDKGDSPTTIYSNKKTFIYGRMLAEIAQYCMEETDANGNSYMKDTPVGEIGTYQVSWKPKKNKYDEQLLEASLVLRTQVAADMATEYGVEIDLSDADDLAYFEANYRQFISDHETEKNANEDYFPYYYKPNGTTVAIINSRLHFNTIYAQAKLTTVPDYTGALELNAIMLGENVAFVTSPNELADYFNKFTENRHYTKAEIEGANDWYDLDDDAYGMPFVLGYSNQNSGYIANWLDHQSNSQTFAAITGKAAEGYMLYAPGTYESMTSDFAAGQGEALIELYNRMLDVAAGRRDRKATCPTCSPNEEVIWKPLYEESAGTKYLGSGHYYLEENFPRATSVQRSTNADEVICIDLNGKTIETDSRFFIVSDGAIVTVVDTAGGGKVISYAANNNPGGGTLSIGSGSAGTVNIYGGIWSFVNSAETSNGGTGIGGIASVSSYGTLNIYGGTLEGADLLSSTYKSESGNYFTPNGCGGAVYLYSGGRLNVYGGTIKSGSVPKTVTTGSVDDPKTSVGKGPCVFLAGSNSRMTLSGDAVVDDIYYNANGGANLTVSGAFSGKAGLTFDDSFTVSSDSTDIGNGVSAVLTGASITCTKYPTAGVYVNNNNLYLSVPTASSVAKLCGPNGVRSYDSAQLAVNDYSGGYIKLLKDETNAVSVTKDLYLDLAGFDITGEVTVSTGKTLYCMDSKTDDYTVADKDYGKITNYSGTVAGVPVEADCAEDGYLMITENKETSFHRINLQLKHMTLRPSVDGKPEPGIYYKSDFAGDEMVAEKVTKFGVALSVVAMPDADNLNRRCEASSFEGFVGGINGGENASTGTLLMGIMKSTNASMINNRNANMPIYGRAYVQLDDGTYLFGNGASRTLREQVEAIDLDSLDDATATALIAMCENFISVTEGWNIPAILDAIQSKNA